MTNSPSELSLRPGLPGAYYASPRLHELELERIFSPSWMCVGRDGTASSTGWLQEVEVAGESVLVVRDRDGKLHGFLNVCRHRGSRLCDPGDSRTARSISCPYHGWTYSLDGKLLGVPNLRDMPDLVKARHGLNRVSVATWGGYLWVCLDPAAGSLISQVEPQVTERLGSLAALEAYNLERLVVGRTIVYDVKANWKSLVENFTECYHCPTIHPELVAAVPEFASGYGSISGGQWHGARLADDHQAFSSSGKAVRPALAGLPPEFHHRFFGVILLPNVFLILVSDHIAFFHLDPLSCDRTRVTCDWLFDPDAVADSDFDPTDSINILDVTNRQDFLACERCQLNASSRALRSGGHLVPAEHLISEFYRYLAEALGCPTSEVWPQEPEEIFDAHPTALGPDGARAHSPRTRTQGSVTPAL